MYIDVLRRLRDAVKEKRPKKWRTNIWFLFHDHVPAHQSVLVKDFLAKNNVTIQEYPSYSPHLAPAEFYLFPRLKSTMRGPHFCDITDIIKNVKEEPKSL